MKKIILLALLATVLFSCSKDYESSFPTDPVNPYMYQDISSYVPKVISRNGDTLTIKTVTGYADKFNDRYKWYNWDRVLADVDRRMSLKSACNTSEASTDVNKVFWSERCRIKVACFEGDNIIFSDIFIFQ